MCQDEHEIKREQKEREKLMRIAEAVANQPMRPVPKSFHPHSEESANVSSVIEQMHSPKKVKKKKHRDGSQSTMSEMLDDAASLTSVMASSSEKEFKRGKKGKKDESAMEEGMPDLEEHKKKKKKKDKDKKKKDKKKKEKDVAGEPVIKMKSPKDSDVEAGSPKKKKKDKKDKKNKKPKKPKKLFMLDNYDYDGMYEGMTDWKPPPTSSKDTSLVRHVVNEVVSKRTADMTKIAMPAHIMEPRSAVEGFSDFVRPDHLVQVPNFDSPRDRMLQMVRSFLAGFLQMRGKENLAKKPYNPVLGEYFRCVWNLEQSENEEEGGILPGTPLTLMRLSVDKEEQLAKTPDMSKAQSGPLSASSQSGLLPAGPQEFTLIAEQVSHHPPVSAFYGECPAASIKIEGNMRAKAAPEFKLSLKPLKGVKVEHEGRIEVQDSKHGEKYKISFPDAYCTNLLVLPQLDFTGEAKLSSTTGYKAIVKFVKPEDDDDRFNIIGSVKDKDGETLAFEGKWNDKVVVTKGKETGQVFIDLESLPTLTKMCQPIEEQDWLESRRLWRKVTKALTEGNTDVANNSKLEIEEKHRHLEIKPSFFRHVGENLWKYSKKTGMT